MPHWTLSSCGEWGLPSSCREWASRCSGFSCCGALALERSGFSSCGTQVQSAHGMWDPPGPGIKPVTPALAGRLLTTGPPGKSQVPAFLSVERGLTHPPGQPVVAVTGGQSCSSWPSLPESHSLPLFSPAESGETLCIKCKGFSW